MTTPLQWAQAGASQAPLHLLHLDTVQDGSSRKLLFSILLPNARRDIFGWDVPPRAGDKPPKASSPSNRNPILPPTSASSLEMAQYLVIFARVKLGVPDHIGHGKLVSLKNSQETARTEETSLWIESRVDSGPWSKEAGLGATRPLIAVHLLGVIPVVLKVSVDTATRRRRSLSLLRKGLKRENVDEKGGTDALANGGVERVCAWPEQCARSPHKRGGSESNEANGETVFASLYFGVRRNRVLHSPSASPFGSLSVSLSSSPPGQEQYQEHQESTVGSKCRTGQKECIRKEEEEENG